MEELKQRIETLEDEKKLLKQRIETLEDEKKLTLRRGSKFGKKEGPRK